MTGKEFLDYLKSIEEETAIEILDDINNQSDRLANDLNEMMRVLVELYRGIYYNFQPSTQSELEIKYNLEYIIEKISGMEIAEVMDEN